MPARYRQVATELRQAISDGQYAPGTTLPAITDLAANYGVSKTTASAAVQLLAAEGLVRPVRKLGTLVLEQRTVRVAFSRYATVLTPGGNLGPWETACQQQGISGQMVVVDVEHTRADDRTARALGITAGDPVICRSRHATIGRHGGQIVQLHTAYYPAALIAGTPLSEDQKVTGGAYAALAAAGLTPVTADETVTTRPAEPDEAAELHLHGGPVLVVDRITRDGAGRALESLRVVADPAHTTLVYDNLPLTR